MLGRSSKRNWKSDSRKRELKQCMDVSEIGFNKIYINAIPLEAGINIYGYVRAWKNGQVGYSVLEEASLDPDFSDCSMFWTSPEDFAKVFKVYGDMEGRQDSCRTGDKVSIDNFRERLKEAIMEDLPADVKDGMELHDTDLVKVNDNVMYGLSFRRAGENACPTFYLNDAYEEYIHGKSMDSIAKEMASMYLFASASTSPDMQDMLKEESELSAESIRDRITMRVVDVNRNRKFLETMPHREIGYGMAVVFDVQNIIGGNDEWRIPITNDVFERLEIDEDELFDMAMDEADKIEPAVLLALDNPSPHGKLKNLFENNKKIRNREAMYVLTNRVGKYGAAALFYPGMTERIAKRIEDSFYAIPSSLNEYIIVPASSGANIERLREKLLHDNSTMVDQEEVLSDNILHYDRERKQLDCVSNMFMGAPVTDAQMRMQVDPQSSVC